MSTIVRMLLFVRLCQLATRGLLDIVEQSNVLATKVSKVINLHFYVEDMPVFKALEVFRRHIYVLCLFNNGWCRKLTLNVSFVNVWTTFSHK